MGEEEGGECEANACVMGVVRKAGKYVATGEEG